MKMILPLLFLIACSSQPSNKSGEELKKGEDFYAIKERRANPPEKVEVYKQASYCLWDGKVLVFKDDKYQHTVEAPLVADKYKLAMETYKGKEAPQKTIYLKQWNKVRDTTDWSGLSRLVGSILTENGFTVVDKPEEAQQMLRMSYGVLDMNGGKYRYLNFNSIDSRAYLNSKKENSYWKAKVSSWGTSSNIGMVLPVMVYSAKTIFKEPETKVSNPVVNEESFEYVTFKDYYGIK